jgi:hypothetical protein
MNPLKSRKQLLLAESELNRALLAGDMATLRGDVRALTRRAKSFSSIASSTAALLAGLAAFRRGKPAKPGAKPSWFQLLLNGAGLVSTIWLALRPPGRDRDGI